nr:hypothetical protein [Mycolicibacterium malmesburyense]CRL78461.1 tautomerase [Mycolicibacterium malmesburyense]
MTDQKTVHEVTFDLLRKLGLTTVFGNPGSTEQTFLQNFPDDFKPALGPAVVRSVAERVAPDAARLAEFAERISAAERPMLVLGPEVDRAGGWDAGIARPLIINGWVRSGHPDDETSRLVAEIADAATRITGIPAARVLVIIGNSPARFAIEGGRVLPDPGQEQAWLAAGSVT